MMSVVFSILDAMVSVSVLHTEGYRFESCRIDQSHSSNIIEQRDICIRNDAGYVTKVREICLQLPLW